MNSTPLAMLYGIAREDDRMLKYIRKLEKSPTDVNSWNTLGEILTENNYYNQAIFTFEKALEFDQNNLVAWISKGKIFLEIFDHVNAQKCFEMATKISPTDVQAWIYRGKANSGLEKYSKAIECYNNALELKPEDMNIVADLYLQKANSHYYLTEYDKALIYYKKYLKVIPDDPVVYVNMGLTKSTVGDFMEAEADYLRALEIDPQNISATRYLCYLYSDSLYLFEKALPLCQRLYELDPNVEYTSYLAETLLKNKSYSQARYYSKEAIKKTREDFFYVPLNKLFIVCSYLLEGNLNQGKSEIEQLLNYLKKLPEIPRIDENLWVFEGLKKAIDYSNIEPRIKDGLANLISFVQGKGITIEEIRNWASDIEKSSHLTIDQELKKIRWNLINLSKEKLERAGSNFDTLEMETVVPSELKTELEIFYDSLERLNKISEKLKFGTDTSEDIDLAYLQTVEGRYDEALKIYDVILSREPFNTNALISKSTTLYRLGNYEEAFDCYERASQIIPNNPYTLVHKGMILEKLGKYERAEACYVEASKLTAPPQDFDAILSKGIALHKLKRYDEALSHINLALSLKPKHDRALITMGITLDVLGRYREAILYYDRALQINPNSVLGLYNKACSLSLQGRLDEALDYLQKAIGLDPGMKNQANSDKDFQSLWNNKRFRMLIV